MKVQEAIELLARMPGDTRLVIADERPGTIGPSPSAICLGIDWDNGVATIHPDKPMTSIAMETVKEMQKFAHEDGWRQYYVREIGKLKARILELEGGQ